MEAGVFDRYRTLLYREASFKPYIIAAMIFLAQCEKPVEMLRELERRGRVRRKK